MNLQNHYELVESDNGYTFETEHGKIYCLSFLFYPLINNNPDYQVYTFNIEPLNSLNPYKKDIRIELTIKYVFQRFFENKVNALVVIYDSCDGRHQARNR